MGNTTSSPFPGCNITSDVHHAMVIREILIPSTPPCTTSVCSKMITITYYQGKLVWALVIAAVLLCLITAMLTGLTLAVCGLDKNWVRLKCVTGSPRERKHAKRVLILKKHGTWMLLSLILCTVACNESFPFLIQMAYSGESVWLPIVISIASLTVFAEIIPQYIMPRRAIWWGYWCAPLIWASMLFTSVVTWPIARVLDSVDKYRNKRREPRNGMINDGIFRNDELCTLIKYHERTGKHGGDLGPDAARIMVGALQLEDRNIGGELATLPETNSDQTRDIEKGDLVVVQGLIVRWNAVKTVRIDEVVNDAFIQKVSSWSYSRIPVIGSRHQEETVESSARSPSQDDDWASKHIFGFLHIKNLLTVRPSSSNQILVKDLRLYPLPTVKDDMPVYDLLNMFQIGYSRMAVVVPAPKNDLVPAVESLNATQSPSEVLHMIWTGSEKSNNRIAKVKEGKGSGCIHEDLTDDSLGQPQNQPQSVQGVQRSKPVGIITFEDIIDAIFQKTSKDEKDYYDRGNQTPTTKSKKAGDSVAIDQSTPVSTVSIPKVLGKTDDSEKGSGTIRKRRVSKNQQGLFAIDGAFSSLENSLASIHALKVRETRKDIVSSSYTQNSDGGFHGSASNSGCFDRTNVLTAEDVAELANPAILSTELYHPQDTQAIIQTDSFPSRKINDGSSSKVSNPLKRVSPTSTPLVIHHVTPRSEQLDTVSKSAGGKSTSEINEADPSNANIRGPRPSAFLVDLATSYPVARCEVADPFDGVFADLEPAREPNRVEAGDTASLNSYYDDDFDEDSFSKLFGASVVPMQGEIEERGYQTRSILEATHEATRPYEGFPIELLNARVKEIRVSKYASKTMPRLMGCLEEEGMKRSNIHPRREESFHDDRALLPSQRKPAGDEGNIVVSRRASSLWF